MLCFDHTADGDAFYERKTSGGKSRIKLRKFPFSGNFFYAKPPV
jgi:hypothetical protein